MEERNIGELLKEEIADEIEGLSQLEPGSEEHSKAVESLTKLYKLKIEEAKNELDLDEKRERRLMEQEQVEKEAEAKAEQFNEELELKKQQFEMDLELRERDLALKENQTVRLIVEIGIGVGVPLLLKLIDVCSYNHWFKKGLIFEETGSISNHMTRGLLTKMTPKR